MITLHSIDLQYIHEPCCSEMANDGCRAMTDKSEFCRSSRCPFYKPQGCKDWIRVEDRQGISVVPPEEYYRYRRTK